MNEYQVGDLVRYRIDVWKPECRTLGRIRKRINETTWSIDCILSRGVRWLLSEEIYELDPNSLTSDEMKRLLTEDLLKLIQKVR